MFKSLLFSVMLFCMAFAKAQTQDEIVAEGWLMYYSERASWHGSDIFLARFPEKRDLSGGYFSYTDPDTKKHKCVFFDQAADPGALVTISFDDSFVVEAAEVSTDARKLTPYEKELAALRKKTEETVDNDKSGFFTRYENTSLNVIPLIVDGKKKVYILTGTSVNGVVLFGNDYLLTFDKNNKLKSKKKLHNNLIPIEYDNNNLNATTMHSHMESTGELITATDICTLLLYGPYASWEAHYVISDDNVCIWNCKNEKLFVITRKAWEKIAKHQAEKAKTEEKDKE